MQRASGVRAACVDRLVEVRLRGAVLQGRRQDMLHCDEAGARTSFSSVCDTMSFAAVPAMMTSMMLVPPPPAGGKDSKTVTSESSCPLAGLTNAISISG